jgi:hypothetical protein
MIEELQRRSDIAFCKCVNQRNHSDHSLDSWESVVSQLFRPFGAESVPNHHPRLTPWALILRRFAATWGLIPTFKLALELRHRLAGNGAYPDGRRLFSGEDAE